MTKSSTGSGIDTRRPKVLIIAFACSPNRGSEPKTGWSFCDSLSENCDLTVISHTAFEADLEGYLSKNPGRKKSLQFHYLGGSPIVPNFFPPYFYYKYRKWNHRAYKLAKHLDKKINFDLIHSITLSGFREPGYCWKMDKPFFWGPISGFQNYPFRFLIHETPKVIFLETLRSTANYLQQKLSRRVKKALDKSSHVYCANSVGISALKAKAAGKVTILPNVGTNEVSKPRNEEFWDEPVFKILWAGLIIPRKSLGLLLEAISILDQKENLELTILGNGPMKKKLQEYAQHLKISKNCQWVERVPYEKVRQFYRSSHVFCFTSMRDTSGNVYVEAISDGLPVIYADHQGVGDMLDAKCGIPIEVNNRKDFVNNLAKAIDRLRGDRKYLKELSAHALEKSNQYFWGKYAQTIHEDYKSLNSVAAK